MRILKFLGIILFILAIILVVNALRLTPKQPNGAGIDRFTVTDSVAEHLSQAIQIKTISKENRGEIDLSEFQKFNEFLARTFPNCEKELNHRIVNGYSHLYTWKGIDESLPGALFIAHLDVVPVEGGTEDNWKYPPFAGQIADGFIWGRGAIDDKVNVIGVLEAAEHLLGKGFKPKRTIYFGFGQDEEISGLEGAKKIAELLKSEGAKLEFVLDEGLFILSDQLPGISAPVAYIGVAEKGYLDVSLEVASTGGHSSQPPKETAVGILSDAIVQLQEHPFPARIDGSLEGMFDYAAPDMPFYFKLVFGNRWLFDPVIKMILSGSPTTNAVIRTTMAPTMLYGSEKANVLPQIARAVVNIRILPGDSSESVLKRMSEVINDSRVKISALPGGNEPLKSSAIDTKTFQTIAATIRGIFPDILVAPSLMIGGTDSKNYAELTSTIYRFSPMQLTDEELAGFHGTNERLRVENLKQIVLFYGNLFEKLE